jgi:capsular polysaccharide biosynthesis protein
VPRRAWYVLAATALAAAAAALYVFLASDRYVATAELAVSPISADSLYRGLPVLRGAGRDDDRPVRTIARLAQSGAVADRVIRRLRLDSRDDALDALEVRVDEDANVVALDGEASRPDRAAQIANAFADEVVSQRHLEFQSAVVTALERVRQQLAQVPASRRNDPEFLPLSRRVTELRTLEGTGDPTISLASAAVAPEEAERPPVWLIPAAAAAAFLLGLAVLTLRRAPRAVAPAPQPAPTDPALAARLERALTRLERVERAPKPAAAPPEPDDRDEVLQRRVEMVTQRELELARRNAEVAGHERTLDEREQTLDERAEELERRAQELEAREAEAARAAAAPPPRPAAAPSGPGAYNIAELERLVEANADAQPDRVEEWTGYLFHLRQYAAADGRLPASFDYLVDETFGELLRG